MIFIKIYFSLFKWKTSIVWITYLKQNIHLFILNFKQLFKPLKCIKLISKNTLTTPYTNSPIEWINNKIKIIKRTLIIVASITRVPHTAKQVSSFDEVLITYSYDSKFNSNKKKDPSSIATRISIQIFIVNRLQISQQHYLTNLLIEINPDLSFFS